MKRKQGIKTAALSIFMIMPLFFLLIGRWGSNGKEIWKVYAEESREEAIEDSDISRNRNKEASCICIEKCTRDRRNKDCEICKATYLLCQSVAPAIKIQMDTKVDWDTLCARVSISIIDMSEDGKFTIRSVKAKTAEEGNWIDITEHRYVDIVEEGYVYVLVTDKEGRIYEEKQWITYLDRTKPTLRAAISDGILSIQAQDNDTGIKVISVNGYEFEEPAEGNVNIRLQQFDAGYPYFIIQAMDYAQNMSEAYRLENPYYVDVKTEKKNVEENPAKQLPIHAGPTNPIQSVADVTEYMQTDEEGKVIAYSSGEVNGKNGREFYTIQTDSGKVFYLIIDQDKEKEKVYFLTEVSETDLLNVTGDTKETLPQNSAVFEAAIPINNTEKQSSTPAIEEQEENWQVEEAQEKKIEKEKEPKEESKAVPYVVMSVMATIGVIVGYGWKSYRKKGETFEEEDEEEEEFERDEEEEERNFFDQDEEEE